MTSLTPWIYQVFAFPLSLERKEKKKEGIILESFFLLHLIIIKLYKNTGKNKEIK